MSDIIWFDLGRLLDQLVTSASAVYYRTETDQLRRTLRADGFAGAELKPGEDLPVLVGEWAGRSVEFHVKQLLLLRTIEIQVRDVLPGVSARPHDAIALLDERVRTGDEVLDEKLSISGDALEVLKCLHPAARTGLLNLVEGGWTVERGDAVQVLSWSEALHLPLADLKAVITAFVEAAAKAPSDLGARIAEETCDALRVRLLTELTHFGPDYLRRNLGPAVARSAHGPTTALVAALLKDGTAWDRAGEEAHAEALRLAPEQVVTLHRSRADEGALIAALSRIEEPLVPLVIDALGAIGTRDAVPHLTPLTERTVLGARSRNAALQAIHQIQARLAGAERGQLTMFEVSSEAGGLAVVEGGSVSVAERRWGEVAVSLEGRDDHERS